LRLGIIDLAAERIRIDVTGTFDSVDAIRRIGIAAKGAACAWATSPLFAGSARSAHLPYALNGRDAVGRDGVAAQGGNVTRLGTDSEALMRLFGRGSRSGSISMSSPTSPMSCRSRSASSPARWSRRW
jgi:multidrug efflux pump